MRSGIVTEVRNSKTLGTLLTFQTEDGFLITYAHLNKSLVKVGDKVEQGEIIAKTGNTGLSTGPHMHYKVMKGEMLIDPMQFVNLKYTDEVVEEYAARGVQFHE